MTKCQYVVMPGGRKDSPRADLGQVIRGLLPPDSEAVAHASEVFTDRLQPLGFSKKGHTHSRTMKAGFRTQHSWMRWKMTWLLASL